MTEKLSEKEKALILLEKSNRAFEEVSKQIKELSEEVLKLKQSFEYSNKMLKRVLNEEANQGNIHKTCRWYNNEKDYCSNYLMGRYTGLAFECSRHKQCIDEIIESHNGDEDD